MSKRGSKSAKFTGGKRWGTARKSASPRNVESHYDLHEERLLSVKERIFKGVKQEKRKEYQIREIKRVLASFKKVLTEYNIIFESQKERRIVFKAFFKLGEKKRDKVLNALNKDVQYSKEALVDEIDRYQNHDLIKDLYDANVETRSYIDYKRLKSLIKREKEFLSYVNRARDKDEYSPDDIEKLKESFLKIGLKGTRKRNFKKQFRFLKSIEVIESFLSPKNDS